MIRAPGSQEGRTGRINGILRRGRVQPDPYHDGPQSIVQAHRLPARRIAPVALAVGMLLVLLPVARAEGTATVTSPDGVNLRSGPGTSFSVLTVVPFNATVSVSGASGDGWYPVTYQGQAGFVLGEYLKLNDAPAPTPAAATTPPPLPTPAPVPAVQPQAPPPVPAATPGPAQTPQTDVRLALVTPTDGLNLRAGPSVAYPVVTTAPGGARVQVVGRPTPDGWYSVIYNTKLGWVDGKYLNFNVPALPVAAPVATPPVPLANSRFVWPVDSRRISTLFSGGHPGIDIDEFPNGGNPVVAVAPGTVSFAGGSMCCSYGLYVVVRHADGYSSLYAHLNSIAVQEGQEVGQGRELGRSGNTGFSTGAHLHFELKKDGAPLNPLSLLPGSYRTD